MSNYFQPTITIDAANITDHSATLVSLTPTLLMPANPNRAGFILQSLSDTNDFWWGYDVGVAVDTIGYFCMKAADYKGRMFVAPMNGVWRGPIYGLSNGGGKFTLKEWTQG